MTRSESKFQFLIKQNKAKLQTVALILLLVIPFLLYFFAQGGQDALVTAFLTLMAFIMVGIIVIS
jgi:hypothetical protein